MVMPEIEVRILEVPFFEINLFVKIFENSANDDKKLFFDILHFTSIFFNVHFGNSILIQFLFEEQNTSFARFCYVEGDKNSYTFINLI